MPQLDIATFAPQLIWLGIWFLILYLLMAKLALPRIGGIIEARRQRREGDLARAAQLKAEAEAAAAAYQQMLTQARAQAQATLKEASDRMAGEAAERQRQLAAALAEQIEAAERRISETKDEALTQVRGIALDVGEAVVEKLTGARPSLVALSAAVDRNLAGAAR